MCAGISIPKYFFPDATVNVQTLIAVKHLLHVLHSAAFSRSVDVVILTLHTQQELKFTVFASMSMTGCVSEGLHDHVSKRPIPSLVGVIASDNLGGFWDGAVDQLWAASAPLAAEALDHVDEGDVGIRFTAGLTDDLIEGG